MTSAETTMIEFYGGYEVYSESGVDLTLLRANLDLSLEKRWQNGQRSLEFALALQQSASAQTETALPFDNANEAIALVKLLAANQVQYVIVGDQAQHAHGSTLMTEVIDICYQRTPANTDICSN